MPQVPFPRHIAKPVKLTQRTPHEVVANVLLGGTFAALAIVGAVVAVRNGAIELFRTGRQTVEVSETPTVHVLGASVPEEQFIAALDGLVVAPSDLPVALAAYAMSDEETGATDAPLAGSETVATQQTVFVGVDPLDVFQSRAYLFASEARAARAFVQASALDALGGIVGQDVVSETTIPDGQGGLLFHDAGSREPDTDRRFAGGVVLSGRVVLVVLGFFPAAVSDRQLAALVAAPLKRYEAIIGGQLQGGDRDTDRDSLTDAAEASLGTDPKAADSDADGYDDLQEVRGGYDPLGPGKLPTADGFFAIPGLTA